MTGKQRAGLRSMANTLPSLYQIGKGGVTPAVTEQLDAALEARELIKITVLETAPQTPREAAEMLAERLHAEPVQCIGRKVTLYRRSKENPKIEL
jgi:RNA-binding protein